MKSEFNVNLVDSETLKLIDNGWSLIDYKALLSICDFQDVNKISENELYGYFALLISNFSPQESAELLLSYRLGNKLNRRKIQDIAYKMQKTPIWEVYPDMSLHLELFNISSLLFKIYNGIFPKPKTTALTFEIEALNNKAKEENQYCDKSLITVGLY